MKTLVVALNPSVDVEWQVASVRWEEKNNVLSERRWPGGKGVNVARWLKFFGAEPTLLLPLGGATGREMRSGLQCEKIPARVIPLRESTRANVIISTASQGQLRFNPAGPNVAKAEWRRILSVIEQWLRNATSRHSAGGGKREAALVLSGSLPRGLSAKAYLHFLKVARRFSVKTFLDCDGVPFAEAVQARPFLVKPNDHELAQWAGRPLKSERALLRAAESLSGITGGWVLVSRGEKGGFLINESEKQFFSAASPRTRVVNTVGAGDAMLAGVIREIMKSSSPAEWLRAGIAAGAAAVQCEAGKLPRSRHPCPPVTPECFAK